MPGLISTPGQIWLSAAPVDLRRGIDGLSALVQQALGQHPCAGSAFVFRNACGNRIKVLLWDGNIVFDYRGGRSGEHARQFLGSWQGHLMVDDYGGYKALFIATRQDPCIELGCWAHARRKFFDLHQANCSPMALEALTRIGQLYPIEQQGKALSSEARLQLRMEQSQPVLNALHEWLIQTCIKTAKGGGSAKALDYTLKRWPALIR